MRSVIKPTQQDLIDRIYRWYSRTYHTPLEDAYDLSQEELMRIYFEDKYLEMRDQELEQEKAELLESQEERARRIKEEEIAAYEADEFARMVAQDEENKIKAEASNSNHDKNSTIAPSPPKNENMLGMLKESELSSSSLGQIPPNITMTFVEEEELQKELEGFGTMNQPAKIK